MTSLHAPDELRQGDGYSSQAVVTAFIAAMIWGYGSTGYGPFRTARVLKSDSDAVEHLTAIAATAQTAPDGGEVAFRDIAAAKASTREYLKYLGPAFGTKYLYFLTAAAPGVEPTPVMDAVVRRWFSTKTNTPLTTVTWDPKSYRSYLTSLDAWRTQLSDGADGEPLTREQVELLIFANARGDELSWTPGTTSIATEELTVDQILELLHEDIAKLAEERGPDGPKLLSQLADWVADGGSSTE